MINLTNKPTPEVTVTKADIGLGNVPNVNTTTTANINDSLDKRFVSDADKTLLGNTSGINTGDETEASIEQKIKKASAVENGYLAKEDFSNFTNKVDKSGDTMTGALTLPAMTMATNYVPTGSEPVGTSYYNAEERCISTVFQNSILDNGKELWTTILNQTGAPIPDGSVVWVTGAVGNSETLTGALYVADTLIPTNRVAGVATQNIINGSPGEVTYHGRVRGLNTTGDVQGEVWSEGDVLYASATTPGQLTNVPPAAPNPTVKIGSVINKHATQGMISVQLDTGSKLTDLHDVNGTPLTAAGQFPVWNNDSKVFDFTANISDYQKKTDADLVYEKLASKGAAGGYCALDGGGKVPAANLPSTVMHYEGTWNASTNTPALTSPDLTKTSWVYEVTVAGTQFGEDWKPGDWLIYNASGIPEKSDNSDDVVSVNGKTGVVTLNKSDVGLSNVDNTSDELKPISNAVQTALGTKADSNAVAPIAHVGATGDAHGEATALVSGFMSSTDKAKLDDTIASVIARPSVSILTTDWVGAVAPYSVSLTLNIPGETITDDTHDIKLYPVWSGTVVEKQAAMDSYSYISEGVVTTNTLTLHCYSFKPEVTLNLIVEVIKLW